MQRRARAAHPRSRRTTIFSAWLKSLTDPESRKTQEADRGRVEKAPRRPNVRPASGRANSAASAATSLLDRGEWDRPKHAVKPHVPALLHPLATRRRPTRLDFARWLVSDKNPLAARVAVNRVWQAMFGTGLVETAEDFGTRTPVPEYLDLLDWLAVDFMEHGWSHKHLIETIVTSDNLSAVRGRHAGAARARPQEPAPGPRRPLPHGRRSDPRHRR